MPEIISPERTTKKQLYPDMNNKVELVTERLYLRPLESADAKDLYSYRSDRVINRYQGWIPVSPEDSEQFIASRVSPVINVDGTWFQFAVILKTSGKMIGDIGLHFFDCRNRQVELGCTLDSNYQGSGYATEALREVIMYLFGTLDKLRLTATIDPENTKSIRLFERLGFRKEELPGKHLMPDGTWAVDLVYALSRDDTVPS